MAYPVRGVDDPARGRLRQRQGDPAQGPAPPSSARRRVEGDDGTQPGRADRDAVRYANNILLRRVEHVVAATVRREVAQALDAWLTRQVSTTAGAPGVYPAVPQATQGSSNQFMPGSALYSDVPITQGDDAPMEVRALQESFAEARRLFRDTLRIEAKELLGTLSETREVLRDTILKTNADAREMLDMMCYRHPLPPDSRGASASAERSTTLALTSTPSKSFRSLSLEHQRSEPSGVRSLSLENPRSAPSGIRSLSLENQRSEPSVGREAVLHGGGLGNVPLPTTRLADRSLTPDSRRPNSLDARAGSTERQLAEAPIIEWHGQKRLITKREARTRGPPFTSIFFKATITPMGEGHRWILSYGPQWNKGFSLGIHNNKLLCSVEGFSLHGGSLPSGETHTVSMMWNGSVLNCQIDGVTIGTQPTPINQVPRLGADEIWLGVEQHGGGRWHYTGKMSGIQFDCQPKALPMLNDRGYDSSGDDGRL